MSGAPTGHGGADGTRAGRAPAVNSPAGDARAAGPPAEPPAGRSDEEGVYRIHWVPGTDQLHGVCFCGAQRRFEGPVELWDWLLSHPDHPNHPEAPTGPTGPSSSTTQAGPPPARVDPPAQAGPPAPTREHAT
jgi:hypothetical protein